MKRSESANFKRKTAGKNYVIRRNNQQLQNALLCEAFAIKPNYNPTPRQQAIILLKLLDVFKS